jgi:glyoxylase-like metal-dependent hydrolase (beta-lactamase superfamily II)
VRIEVIPVTQWVQNCTIVCPDSGGPSVLIDPGGEIDRVLAVASEIDADIEGILITHGHIDHIGGLNEAIAATGASVWLHPDDEWLYDMSMMGAEAPGVPEGATRIGDGDTIEIAGMRFGVLHTPGHSPGHVCFTVEDADEPTIIGGDLVFFGSIGRTDLPRGDLRTLVTSVKEKIWTLPDETTILPGHGPSTSVGFEKQYNPFVSLEAIEDLVG